MKIGIASYYYKSINYGGLFQSYALCKFLRDNGYQAEQLCINHTRNNGEASKRRFYNFLNADIHGKINTIQSVFVDRVFKKTVARLIACKMNERVGKAALFAELIPHSQVVYDYKNFDAMENEYDVFIAGSDRIWNMTMLDSPYFLKFIQHKPKLAYAVSLTTYDFDNSKEIREALKNYTSISVREFYSIDSLKRVYDAPISWVVDPTLLVDKEVWFDMSKDNVVDGKYVFCYFLGESRKYRKLVEQYAKDRNLKVVNISNANGTICFSDFGFGDIKICDASPEEILGFIRYAETVFTDSFHATVLSTVFNKQFFVFQRVTFKGSGTRIESFLKLIGDDSHFLNNDGKITMKYIGSLKQLDYKLIDERIRVSQSVSRKYLLDTLNRIKL